MQPGASRSLLLLGDHVVLDLVGLARGVEVEGLVAMDFVSVLAWAQVAGAS
jgi:FKBP-type peptidyl-prolyl cis-trans isomerase (trigger factor)